MALELATCKEVSLEDSGFLLGLEGMFVEVKDKKGFCQ